MSDLSSVAALKARANQVMLPRTRYWPDDPIVFDHGRGAHFFDVTGKDYLDMFGGVATVSVGYGNPHVAGAIAEQAAKGMHCSELLLHEIGVLAAERLAGIAPDGLTKSYFVNSGSEANELAARIAMRATGRTGLISLMHAYHGRTPTAAELTFQEAWRNAPPYAHNVHFAPNPYALRRPGGMDEDTFYHWCLKQTEEAIRHAHGGTTNFAAIWVEPIQGNGGVVSGPAWYYDELVRLAHKYGGLVIADEVQTGFGRTGGKWFGCQWWSEVPDIMVMAKGIANGFPMGAVSTTPEIGKALQGWLNFNTFGGNPLACAAMLATIDEIESMWDNVLDRGDQLLYGMDEMRVRHPMIAEVRGRGLMLGVEFVDLTHQYTPNPKLMMRLHRELRDRGVFVGKGGPEGNVMRIKPPYCLTSEDCDQFLVALEESLTVAEAA